MRLTAMTIVRASVGGAVLGFVLTSIVCAVLYRHAIQTQVLASHRCACGCQP